MLKEEREEKMNQQVNENSMLATKFLNRLASTELELIRNENKIDELNQKISQITEANQKLQNENQQLKQNLKINAKGEE